MTSITKGLVQPALDLHMMSGMRLCLSLLECLMQEFFIPSMSCGGCASRITQTLHNLDASARVAVDLPNKTVRVDSNQESASIEAALKEAGYPPIEIESIAKPETAGTGKRRSGCCCG